VSGDHDLLLVALKLRFDTAAYYGGMDSGHSHYFRRRLSQLNVSKVSPRLAMGALDILRMRLSCRETRVSRSVSFSGSSGSSCSKSSKGLISALDLSGYDGGGRVHVANYLNPFLWRSGAWRHGNAPAWLDLECSLPCSTPLSEPSFAIGVKTTRTLAWLDIEAPYTVRMNGELRDLYYFGAIKSSSSDDDDDSAYDDSAHADSAYDDSAFDGTVPNIDSDPEQVDSGFGYITPEQGSAWV